MRPTRWYVLLCCIAVAGGAGYALSKAAYSDIPSPSVFAVVWLLLLALAEAYTALVTRARLKGRPGTRPINPLVVARLVALAKASSIVGALAAGGYAGFLGWVAQLSSPAGHRDTRTAALGIAVGVALLGGALLLEWVCRVPKDDEQDD